MKLPIKGLLISISLGLAVHYLTPHAATLMYELYHLVKFEAIYTVYGAMRFLSANFMFWEGRTSVSVAIALAGCIIVLWRAFREHQMEQT